MNGRQTERLTVEGNASDQIFLETDENWRKESWDPSQVLVSVAAEPGVVPVPPRAIFFDPAGIIFRRSL